MGLLKHYLRSELDTLLSNNIRFRVIGPRARARPGGQERARARGAAHRDQHRAAVQHRAQLRRARRDRRRRDGAWSPRSRRSRASPDAIEEADIARHLYTAGQPDPDLLIRTSGELRISNFLLWQIAYSEIWVTDVLWPDFRRKHLLQAIVDFQKRERRYGGIAPA